MSRHARRDRFGDGLLRLVSREALPELRVLLLDLSLRAQLSPVSLRSLAPPRDQRSLTGQSRPTSSRGTARIRVKIGHSERPLLP